MVRRIVRGLRERVDHMLWCWSIGIADSEADDVDPALLRLAHFPPDLDVQIWRELVQALGLLDVHSRLQSYRRFSVDDSGRRSAVSSETCGTVSSFSIVASIRANRSRGNERRATCRRSHAARSLGSARYFSRSASRRRP